MNVADVGAFLEQLPFITAAVSCMLQKSFVMLTGVPSVSAFSAHTSTASNARAEKYSTSGARELQASLNNRLTVVSVVILLGRMDKHILHTTYVDQAPWIATLYNLCPAESYSGIVPCRAWPTNYPRGRILGPSQT